MNYISLSFATLVAALLIVYYVLPKKWRLQGVTLLLGSLLFYLSFDLRHILFLLFTAASTYFSARLIQKKRGANLVLILCIAVNVAVWYAVKALPWTIALSNKFFSLIDSSLKIGDVSIIVPIGISYFTLQAIGYLVDVYKGKIEAEKNPLKYLLFLSFFPAVVQGPISRYTDLAPQLFEQKSFFFENFRKGLLLVLFGFVKKVVVADRIGIFVNTAFEQYHTLNGIILYLVAVGYAIQLYMDFSGCVDICRGVSKLFGIELVNNFNRPYLSRSIKEFWSKWHMSLSGWLKDYVYIPLGGNRKGTARKYLNLLITFLVSGLWHGAEFSFFVWGALHAIYQIVGQCTDTFRKKVKTLLCVEAGSVSEKIFQTVITFNLVTFAWVFFRAPSLSVAVKYIYRMFTTFFLDGSSIFTFGVGEGHFLILFLHLIVFFAVDLCSKSQDAAVEGILKTHLIIRWVIYLLLIFDVILFGAYGSGYDMSGFMYGGF